MSTQFDQLKVLEICQISPPPNSVATTSLPLNYLDFVWLTCCPIKRVFLYQVSLSAAQFTEEVLPQLKNSLSLALQRFFPLCGNCVCPPETTEPFIMFSDGDSIPLLVAQSTGTFSDFLRHGPRDAKDIHPLVPETLPTRVLDDTLEEITPLFAVQVTLFPNAGLCIGVYYRHIVADGMSCMHFMKTWASIFKVDCDMSKVSISLPIHDKEVIRDPSDIKNFVLDQRRAWGSPAWKEPSAFIEDNVRATFTLSHIEIERLKKQVSTKMDKGLESAPLHLSSYVVTSAFIWVCLMKTLDVIKVDDSSNDHELCHFVVTADCRYKHDMGIPTTYFGNCLTGQFVSVARCIFRKEGCFITVAEAISHGVQRYKNGRPDEYKYVLSKLSEVWASGENILTVAGSPKLAVYETDFGWGRPEMVEAVHIDISGSISLTESRNDKVGIEVGLCRSRHQMEVFTSFFHAGLNQFV